ncbi:DNA replication/repair protein RecF [Denitrificimonas sp. JX-1]|uniref:DNA replication and repair protein RecF n=1 Tax=Denitrificimonas halotolerans TaxID=3098930 RepID=A0ABU5GS94_9GAMM|nr:DNA replication/repair protein RecF [Denitrificimonas sp. JX-1]MDY7219843.1 DNA replication/repair protein RecF [Denitrificimonas sp. JX-1]
MAISQLQITGIRNLQPVTLHASARINILHGDNGSGKTSVLEAIHLLAMARSFRSTRLQPMIQHERASCTVFAQIEHTDGSQTSLGISRDRQSELRIRINGQNARSAAQLAQLLPLQLINPDSFRLLEGAPKMRRQFLDWGVFHVEHQFISAWQRLQTSLKQRNSYLRHGIMDSSIIAAWDHELCLASNEIDQLRRAYITQLKPVFEKTLAKLLNLPSLTLSYFRGWDKNSDLQEVLDRNLERDKALGYTQAGPQRADLRVRIEKNNAVDILSRGQQKLVICALRIAQGYLLSQARRNECIYLVDDLPSELDEQHRSALCQLLDELECQVFITCVDKQLMSSGWRTDTPVSLFHVEQGQITPSGVTA